MSKGVLWGALVHSTNGRLPVPQGDMCEGRPSFYPSVEEPLHHVIEPVIRQPPPEDKNTVPHSASASERPVFTGEIETTRIMIARRDIRGSIQNAIRTMRQQGELLVAALVVVQIEGDPDTDPAQFDYRAGAYTELVAASGRRRAAGHIIELLKHETE